MTPRRILVIHLKRVGDILLATPLLAELRELYPQACIDFLVYQEYASVLLGNPDIDHLLVYSKKKPWTLPGLVRRGKYDWVIDLLADGASAWACFFSGAPKRIAFENRYPGFIHNVRVPKSATPMYSPALKLHLLSEATALMGGAKIDPKKLRADSSRLKLTPPRERVEKWRAWLASDGPKGAGPIVVMSPTSRRNTRRWRADGFAEVAKRLAAERGARVLCLWDAGERAEAEKVVALAASPSVALAPRLNDVQDLAAFVSLADVVVGNCNGTRHVAVALNVPGVTVHMSSDPFSWNPPNPDGPGFHPRWPVVRNDALKCIPCQSNVCAYNMECSTELPASRVFDAAVGLLAGARR